MKAVEEFITAIKLALPGVQVRQLQVSHPSDDAGLWFVTHASSDVEVNVESHDGEFPFLIENSKDDARLATVTVDETVSAVCIALGRQQTARPVAARTSI